MFYSTYIFKERDKVPVLGFTLSNEVDKEFTFKFASFTINEAAQFLKLAAKFVKNKKCLEGVQFYILAEYKGQTEKIPVDHFLWSLEGSESRIDFTNGANYIRSDKVSNETFSKKNLALKRLSNLIKRTVK